MRIKPPFSVHNRPWLTIECIEAMNEQFIAVMLKIPEKYRKTLRAWVIVQVEIGHLHEKPDVLEACKEWGSKTIASAEAGASNGDRRL
jgi:hypothetical protein